MRVGLVDGDDHAAVAEPLGDAHAALAGDLAGDRAERAEDPPGGVVAVGGGVVREPGEVDEDEGRWVPACRAIRPATDGAS